MITLKNAIDNLINEVKTSVDSGLGGPFGAFVYKSLYKNEGEEYIELIATGTNCVTRNNDPTAHAEIIAIRNACNNIGAYDLSGYNIYATGFPCPMCLGAILWAGIGEVVYSQSLEDAHDIGFRDKMMYETVLKLPNSGELISFRKFSHPKLSEIYDNYKNSGVIY